MGRDRWSTLAVRAYTKKLIGFTEADRQDDRWKLREELIFSQLEHDARLRLRLALHLEAAIGAQHPAPNVSEHYRERVREHYQELIHLLMSYDISSTRLRQSLIEDWKRIFGDPEDPEVAGRIEQTIEFLKGIQDDRRAG